MSDDYSHKQSDVPRPLPYHLADLHGALKEYADKHACEPPQPPIPLILAAYHHSTEEDKDSRWREMQEWAERNGCAHLLADVTDQMADDLMIRQHGRGWRTTLFTPQQAREDLSMSDDQEKTVRPQHTTKVTPRQVGRARILELTADTPTPFVRPGISFGVVLRGTPSKSPDPSSQSAPQPVQDDTTDSPSPKP